MPKLIELHAAKYVLLLHFNYSSIDLKKKIREYIGLPWWLSW